MLSDRILCFLDSIQLKLVPTPKNLALAYVGCDDGLDCKSSCYGSCDCDCSGGCESSCSGSCDDSCSGACEYAAM